MKKELELEVRVSVNGEYDDTIYPTIEVPADTPEDKLMDVMMSQLTPAVEDEYGDLDAWDDGEVSWTLDSWGDA